MRDVTRIEPMLEELKSVWEQYPDLRLGQLICDIAKGDGETFYQVTDPFTLFCIKFLKKKKFDSWNEYINTQSYNSWRGNSFEIVCVNHINQIKESLGISGIETNEFAWRSNEAEKGAQIELEVLEEALQVIKNGSSDNKENVKKLKQIFEDTEFVKMRKK